MAKQQDRTPRWPIEWPLVVCEDGPRAGAWYFELAEHGGQHSWESQVALAQEAVDLGAEDVNTLGYVLTEETMESRRFDDVVGKVMKWRPDDISA